MITDAKCLFDSYHKESMSTVDRRSGLEIRVVKEQLEGLGGRLLWVSSERQLADGLTKMSVRQTFADKLRHGRVKFLFDPQYIAAKKKSLSERQTEAQKSSKTPASLKKAKVIDLDPIPEEPNVSEEHMIHDEIELTCRSGLEFLGSNEVPVDAEAFVEHAAPDDEDTLMYEEIPEEIAACAEDEVSAIECFAQSDDVLVYVNARRHVVPEYQITVLLMYVFKTLLFFWTLAGLPLAHGASTEVCLTSGNHAALTGSNNNLNWSVVAVFLVFAILAFLFFCRMRRDRRWLEQDLLETQISLNQARTEIARLQAMLDESGGINRRANTLSIMYDELHSAFVRRSAAYDRARRAFLDAQTAARQYQAALRVAARDMGQGYQAILDLNAHHAVCPMGDEVYIQLGSELWHTDDECDEIYNSGREIQTFRFCPICAQQNLIVQNEDEPRHFDEHGVRVMDAPTWMDFT